MGGIVGRLFREFTATLSLAIMISMVISLTTTPMMCALLLRLPTHAPGRPRAAQPVLTAPLAVVRAHACTGRCATAGW